MFVLYACQPHLHYITAHHFPYKLNCVIWSIHMKENTGKRVSKPWDFNKKNSMHVSPIRIGQKMISKSMQLHINQYRAWNNNNNNKEMNKKKRADHRFVIWVLRSHDDRNMHSTSSYNNEIEYVSAKKSTESLSSIQIRELLWCTEHFRDYIIWLHCTWSLVLFSPSYIKPWRWMRWIELDRMRSKIYNVSSMRKQ